MLNQLLRELLEQLIARNQLELSQDAHLPTLIRDLQQTMNAAPPFQGVANWLSENLIAHRMVEELYATNAEIIEQINQLRLS